MNIRMLSLCAGALVIGFVLRGMVAPINATPVPATSPAAGTGVPFTPSEIVERLTLEETLELWGLTKAKSAGIVCEKESLQFSASQARIRANQNLELQDADKLLDIARTYEARARQKSAREVDRLQELLRRHMLWLKTADKEEHQI